jgi:hypothetical protein
LDFDRSVPKKFIFSPHFLVLADISLA